MLKLRDDYQVLLELLREAKELKTKIEKNQRFIEYYDPENEEDAQNWEIVDNLKRQLKPMVEYLDALKTRTEDLVDRLFDTEN